MDSESPEVAGGAGRAAVARPGPTYLRVIAYACVGLFVIAVLFTAYLARVVVVPIVLALLLALLLTPLVRGMRRRLHLPQPLAACVAVFALVAAIVVAFYALSAPAARWVTALPGEMVQVERKLRALRAPVEEVQRTAEQIERLTAGEQERAAPRRPDQPVTVVMAGPSLVEILLGQTREIGVGAATTGVLLLFLLATGDSLLRRAVAVAPTLGQKRTVVEIVREAESEISHYLLTISLINAGLGIAIGTAMWLLGMPNPALWGVLAGLLNFIPYLGGLVGVAVVALVALITFETPWMIVLPPLAYIVLNGIEGQLITPALLARRLTLNAVAVILSLIVWTWLWGIIGALLAVPLLAAFKIVCDHVERLRPLGVMLGQATSANGARAGHPAG